MLGRGNIRSGIVFAGEAPGRTEIRYGAPFVGASGMLLGKLCSKAGVNFHDCYRTNVFKTYIDGNPTPSSEDLSLWELYNTAEIEAVGPKLIVAVGAVAARYFLGENDLPFRTIKGVVHAGGCFDSSTKDRSCGAAVIPIMHPAAALYESDLLPMVWSDVRNVGAWHRGERSPILDAGCRERSGLDAEKTYRDVSGIELKDLLSDHVGPIGIDTEGDPGNPWSIQVAVRKGEAYLLRCSRSDFSAGIGAIRELVESGCKVAMHNALYDVQMCHILGIDRSLFTNLFDSMYAAYIMRTEPQGLKALSWRWLGVKMRTYLDVCGSSAEDMQLDFLLKVVSRKYPKVGTVYEHKNDGTISVRKPQSVSQRCNGILRDFSSGKKIDLKSRWNKIDDNTRAAVDKDGLIFPDVSLEYVELEAAADYACMDADITLSLMPVLQEQLAKQDLEDLMARGMRSFLSFSEIQDTGMCASWDEFSKLKSALETELDGIRLEIASIRKNFEPFNPKSPADALKVCLERGLKPRKKTKKGKWSTAAKSIQEYRYTDPVVDRIFEWRERQHIRDSFCIKPLELLKPGEIGFIRSGDFSITRTTSRRNQCSEPNLLNIPSVTRNGLRVRACYLAPEGYVYAAVDYSQLEIRLIADRTQDQKMCQALRDGKDIHTFTAALMFGIDESEVDSMEHRRPIKPVGFGISYGMGPPGLLDQFRTLGIDRFDLRGCKRLLEGYLDLFSGIRKYKKFLVEKARESLEIRDAWDMPRFVPGLVSQEKSIIADAERYCLSHDIQGTAQGMIQQAQGYLYPVLLKERAEGLDFKWCLQLHDELIFLVKESHADALISIVKDGMENHNDYSSSVPITVSAAKGKKWSDLKD